MDNRPKVFPTPEQIASANQTGDEIANMQEQSITSGQVSTSEAAAAAEMARRTYEQLKAREEALKKAELEPIAVLLLASKLLKAAYAPTAVLFVPELFSKAPEPYLVLFTII